MITFAKAHAYGNDFLYVPQSEVTHASLPPLAREMCDRHTGIGADGLVVYEPTARGAAMQLFNADGGRAEVSGNGVRGLAALLACDDRSRREVAITTDSGTKLLVQMGADDQRQTFRAAMGLPSDIHRMVVAAHGEPLDVVVLSMGNPQAVLLGPLPTDDRFHTIGRALATHPSFPEGTNVEFAWVEAPDRVRIAIWERGVGPTSSSGTGSCAALVAAASYGGAARSATVIAPGGAQLVEWNDDSVYLTGWAEVVCRGQWLRPLSV